LNIHQQKSAPAASSWQGITHYRLGDTGKALNIFQRGLVLATKPEDQAAASLWIGKIHLENNDRPAAISGLGTGCSKRFWLLR
jgi:hypothetical protein